MQIGWKLLFVTLLASFPVFSTEASNLDAYRAMLANKKFTLSYENITPLPRDTNKEKVNFYGMNGMDVRKVSYLQNRQLRGLVVVNGADKYEEVGYADSSVCSLTKGSKVYDYTKKIEQGKLSYTSELGKGKIAAYEKDYIAELVNGSSYADANLTRLLNAILPVSAKSMDMPVYQFVGSGVLANGLSFEDYRTNVDEKMEAVRYYFQGQKLVKIAAANYSVVNNKLDGEKIIIKIKNFEPNPNLGYLQLPAGLKDVTK